MDVIAHLEILTGLKRETLLWILETDEKQARELSMEDLRKLTAQILTKLFLQPLGDEPEGPRPI